MVKGLKDPNKPKKPMTAFFLWRSKNDRRIRNSLKPGFTFKELAQALSKEWAALAPEHKKPFEKQYESEHGKFTKLMKAYKLTANYALHQEKLKEFKITKTKKSKFGKDPNAPKRPMNAYLRYVNTVRDQIRATLPDHSKASEVTKRASVMWQNLSEAEKKKFQDETDTEKATYEKRLAAYKKTAEFKQYQESKATFTSAKKKKVAKLTKSPTKKKSKKKAASVGKKRVRKARKAKKSGRKPKAPKRVTKAKRVSKRSTKKARKSAK